METQAYSRFGDRIPATPAELDHLSRLSNLDHVAEVLAGVELVPGTEVNRTLEAVQIFIDGLHIGDTIMVDGRPAIVRGGNANRHSDPDLCTARIDLQFPDGSTTLYRAEDHQFARAA